MINNKQHKKVREHLYEMDNGISPFFFGFYEKKKRKEFGYSLENVSKDLLISKGNLSEMENGLRPMKKEVFDRFLSQYNINFDTDLNYIFNVKNILVQMVDCFLRFDDQKQEKVREHFETMKENWQNSYACFNGMLVQYFIKSVIKHQNGDMLFQSLAAIETCLSNDERAVLYMIRGMEGRWNSKLNNMTWAFKKALGFVEEIEIFGLKALIEYYQIGEWMRIGPSFEVYEKCVQIRKKFYSSHNYIRALYLDNLEGLCVMFLRAYESAYARFEALLANMNYVNDPYLRFCVAQNAILVLCVMRQYQKALDLMKKEKDTFQFGLSNFVFAPLCLYMLNEKEKAERILDNLKTYIVQKNDLLLCEMIRNALLEEKTKTLETAFSLLKEDHKIREHETEEIVYQFMIHFCKKMGLDQRRMEIQEQYIACLTR